MANPGNKIEKDIQNEIQKENKMGVMPVGKLLFTMSLPIMISMLVQALYNVVDSMFVARVSENALTALSIAFPIQNLMIAVSVGLGVGLNAVVSRALGAKDTKGVNRAATNGIMLMFICGLLFMLGGATLVRPYFEMQISECKRVFRYIFRQIMTEIRADSQSRKAPCSAQAQPKHR